MYLKSILSTHPDSTIRELKWTQSDVVTWFKEAKIKKRSKKVVTCNVQFPPPLIYSCSVRGSEGYHKRCLLRVPTCSDSQRPQSHHHRCTCGRGFRGKGRLARVGPSPLRQVFRTDQQPTYHAHGVLWGIEFLLARAPKPSSEGAAKRQRLTILGAWLQAKGEGQGQVGTAEAPPPCLSWGCTVLGLHQPSFSL